jgi:hypothetical protein
MTTSSSQQGPPPEPDSNDFEDALGAFMECAVDARLREHSGMLRLLALPVLEELEEEHPAEWAGERLDRVQDLLAEVDFNEDPERFRDLFYANRSLMNELGRGVTAEALMARRASNRLYVVGILHMMNGGDLMDEDIDDSVRQRVGDFMNLADEMVVETSNTKDDGKEG